jgi:hypothetical protein
MNVDTPDPFAAQGMALDEVHPFVVNDHHGFILPTRV